MHTCLITTRFNSSGYFDIAAINEQKHGRFFVNCALLGYSVKLYTRLT